MAAADVVLAVSALIETAGFPLEAGSSGSSDGASADDSSSGEATAMMKRSWMTAFNEGFDCLSFRSESDELLERGIQEAISIQKVHLAKTYCLYLSHAFY